MMMSKKYLWVVVTALALVVSGCSRLGMGSARPDTQIAGDVKSRIETDANVPEKQININAANGVVTLSGTVSSDAARNAAANDAAQVEGVKTVVNNLEVNAAAAANAAPQSQPEPQTQAQSQPAPAAKPSARWESSRPPARRPARSNPGQSGSNAGNNGSNEPSVTTGNSGGNNSTEASNQAPPPPPQPTPIPTITLPAGTKLDIRLNEQLSSETAQVGDVFHGSIATPVSIGEKVAIPTTADVEGRVVDVKSAGRFKGQSDLVIELTRVMMNGKNYSIVTDRWSKEGSSRGKATAAKVGGGAALGAIIGAIAGGGKGAAIGGAAGAGVGTGVAGATKGQQIILKPETVLSFQLQNPVTVTPGASRQSMNSN
jgi:BON domain-containing protein